MNDLIEIFLNNLLPIFIVAGVGYLVSRFIDLEARTLSQLILYVFSPCLIFTLITQSELNTGDLLRMMLLASLLIGLLGCLTWVAGKLLRLERRILSGVMLASMFMNAGNYGLPVVLFAFGETALGYASLFFVTNAALASTLGVVVASAGSTDLLAAFRNLFKLPTLYALVAAVIILRAGWQIPLPVGRAVKLLGDASIPAMLVMIGMLFRKVKWNGQLLPIALASGMRLLVSPALTIALIPLFGVMGPARQAGILESAMPTAILTTVLATEFEAEPVFVTSTVFVTTLLSPLVLTPLLAYLGA